MSSKNYQMYIDGEFIATDNQPVIEVFNPATRQLISTVPDGTVEQAKMAIDAAARAQKSWEKLPAIQRAYHLKEISQQIRRHADYLAQIITKEQGKILSLAKTEVDFTADYIDYMAEWARRYEGEILPSDRPNENIFIFKQAIGVTTGILPWNFPFFLIARKMAPALLCGNTIVIKPSEETPNNAFEFARLVQQTSLPKGVFNLVSGYGDTVGHELASNKKVGLVSFTGSVKTGTKIMQAAASNIIKVSLELGGKAPAIVMADADINAAVQYIKNSRIINSGQVCNCAERVYVQKQIYQQFIEKLTAEMSKVSYGNPLTENVDMGPLVCEKGLKNVHNMVKQAVISGAKATTGGKIPANTSGWYYEPTVLTEVRQDMEIMQKEIFGPVLPVMQFDTLDEAIDLANDCEYGLTSSVYTKNLDIAMRASRELKFGETYINRENFEAMQGFHAGWRKSGIGGADGKHGLQEYLQTHAVYLQYDLNAK